MYNQCKKTGMDTIEISIGWGLSLMVLLAIFVPVHRNGLKRAPDKRRLALLRILAVALALQVNVLLTTGLHEPMMFVFDVNTLGFMNINGLLMFMAIWCVVSVILLVLVHQAKDLLGIYHNTLRLTYILCIAAPFLLAFASLIATGLR